jgi:glucose-1-phosphate adenylyltransferase
MNAAGLIFSNIHDESVSELTRIRTMASVPFGCRYRMIDFALSNMVNAGITKVGIITHFNYQSLLDHIGNGKDWDLARRSGGIKILPPFITAYDSRVASKVYETKLEALIGVMNFLNRCNEDTIVLSDCDAICNLPLDEMLERHEARGADVTIITHKTALNDEMQNDTQLRMVKCDADGRVVELLGITHDHPETADLSTNVILFRRKFLLDFLQNAQARGWKDFYPSLSRYLLRSKVFAQRFDGYFTTVNSLSSYFTHNMELLQYPARAALFGDVDRPILTKVRNSSPTSYLDNANVKNSLVADGCVIDGTVENCILFRGVHIGKGTVVRNSILMQDTYVGNHVDLNCVITDKNALIRDSRHLSGDETLPFYVGKHMMI